MIWRAFILATAALVLSGCATRYDPVVMDVKDSALLEADQAECIKIAETAGKHFDAAAITGSSVTGAVGSVDLAAIDAWSIAAGAAEGLISSLFEWTGLTSNNKKSVFQACLTRRAEQHHYGVLGLR
jgi:hypothetical protein